MLLFIRAERTGDWKLHLYSVKKMLPHFHAVGHLTYAKSAHLNAQQIEQFDTKISGERVSQIYNNELL